MVAESRTDFCKLLSEQNNAWREAAGPGNFCSPALIRFLDFLYERYSTLCVVISVVLCNTTRIVGDCDNGAIRQTHSEQRELQATHVHPYMRFRVTTVLTRSSNMADGERAEN